jgi:ATP-dependent Clp protease ATP-binding subunit ClpC
MFERFTDRARRVLTLAEEEARLLDHGFIGTEHLLLGLISEGEGLAAKVLESLDISLDSVRREVEQAVGRAHGTPRGSPPFTPRAKKVLELSLREALQLGHNYIGTEHILLGLIREGDGVAALVLARLGADLVKVRQTVVQQLSAYEGTRQMAPSPSRPTFSRGVPTGETCVVEVVRAGRGPEVFAAAYERVRELVTLLGSTVDDDRVSVTSVDTVEGPGLRLSVRHAVGASAEDVEPAQPEGTEEAGGGGDSS